MIELNKLKKLQNLDFYLCKCILKSYNVYEGSECNYVYLNYNKWLWTKIYVEFYKITFYYSISTRE